MTIEEKSKLESIRARMLLNLDRMNQAKTSLEVSIMELDALLDVAADPQQQKEIP